METHVEHGMNLELDEVGPIGEPLVELGASPVHHLIAGRQILRDPAVHIREAFRRHPAAFSEPLIDRPRLSVAKPLDHYEEHP